MTLDEAKEYAATLPPEEIVQIVHEHYQLRQHLCAQTLLVPTGTDNWIVRAIRRAQHLTTCRSLLRKNLHTLAMLVEETTIEEFHAAPECSNCTGTGKGSDNNSCVICRGSGRRVLSL